MKRLLVILSLALFSVLSINAQEISVNVGVASCDIVPITEFVLPEDTSWAYTTQVLYDSVGFLDDRTITTIAYKIVSYVADKQLIIRVSMKDTKKKKLKMLQANMTEVYCGHPNIRGGYINIQLQKPFKHKPGHNLIIQVETFKSGRIVFEGASKGPSLVFRNNKVIDVNFVPRTVFLY